MPDLMHILTQQSLDVQLTIPMLLDLLTGPFQELVRPSRNFVEDIRRYSTLRGLWTAWYVSSQL